MITRRQFLYSSSAAALAIVAQSILNNCSATIGAQIIATDGGPVVNARITLFTPDLL